LARPFQKHPGVGSSRADSCSAATLPGRLGLAFQAMDSTDSLPPELQLVARELNDIERNLDLFEETKDARFMKEAAAMIKANAPRIKTLSSKDDYKLPGTRKEALDDAKNRMRKLFARAKSLKTDGDGASPVGSPSPSQRTVAPVAAPTAETSPAPTVASASAEPAATARAPATAAAAPAAKPSQPQPKAEAHDQAGVRKAARQERLREQEEERLREAEDDRAEMLAQLEDRAAQDAAEEERVLKSIRQPKAKGEKRGDDLWSKALDERDAGHGSANEDEHHTLVFVGERGAGKTTLMYRVLERSDAVQATVGIEYAYGTRPKRMSTTQAQDVIHGWELAGDSKETGLLDASITPLNLHRTTAVVCVNLAAPAKSFERAVHFLDIVRKRVDECMKQLKIQQNPTLGVITKRSEKQFAEHEDRSSLKPLGIPLIVVAGHYDAFEDYDPQSRKIACKALRYLALQYGGALVFTSTEEEALLSRFRTAVYTSVLHAAPRKATSVDPNKPLLVPVGADTFAEIGTPSGTGNAHSVGIQAWKDEWADLFKDKKSSDEGIVDESRLIEEAVKYSEHSVDAARMDKDQELEKYKREAASRAHGNANFSSSSSAAPSSQFERAMAKRTQ
jgi:dynein cytoplasmic 2 light intermediate chain